MDTESITIPFSREEMNSLTKKGFLANGGNKFNDKGNQMVSNVIQKELGTFPLVTSYQKVERAFLVTIINGLAEDKTFPQGEKRSLIEYYFKQENNTFFLNEKFHNFKIEPTLCDIFAHTTNEIFFRNLPFREIVLDCDVRLKGKRIQGIIVIEFHQDPQEVIIENINPNEMMIFSFYSESNETDYNKLCTEYGPGFHKFYLSQTKTEDEKSVAEFVCNFIDFLDNPDIEIKVVHKDEERDRKRIRRGKPAIPTTVSIVLKGRIKEYYDSIETNLSHKFKGMFWIRGHWRHYRSEWYKRRKGQKEWIMPYLKGEGVLVKKDYNLKKEESL